MFIRLKTAETKDFNVNINEIALFKPNGTGAILVAPNGSTVEVLDSTRSIRGYIKKALFAIHTGGAGPAEDTDEV